MQVISRKRATNYRALLRKMTCKDKASYDSTPLCTTYTGDIHTDAFSHTTVTRRCHLKRWRVLSLKTPTSFEAHYTEFVMHFRSPHTTVEVRGVVTLMCIIVTKMPSRERVDKQHTHTEGTCYVEGPRYWWLRSVGPLKT